MQWLVATNRECLFFLPDSPERFAKIVVNDFTAGARQASLMLRFAAKFFQAAGLDGGDHLRDQGAWTFGLNEEATIEEQRRVSGILAGNTLRNLIDATAL